MTKNNYKNPIKLKKQTTMQRVSNNDKLITKITKLQNYIDNTPSESPFFSINEQYAHDLVIMTMIFDAIEIKIKTKKEDELDKYKRTDVNSKQNMETYFDFKENYKYLKIIQTKKTLITDKNVLEQLEINESKTKNKLDDISQHFEFYTENGDDHLIFGSVKEVVDFLDVVEKMKFENAYRMDIVDLDEILKISKTPINELFTLAEETQNQDNQYIKSESERCM